MVNKINLENTSDMLFHDYEDESKNNNKHIKLQPKSLYIKSNANYVNNSNSVGIRKSLNTDSTIIYPENQMHVYNFK